MLVAGLVAVAALLLLPGLLVGPSLDAAVFAHVSGRLLDGATLYVDTWDHKPPGIFILNAVSQLLLGWVGDWTAIWIVSLLVAVGTGGLVAVVLRRLEVFDLAFWLALVTAMVAGTQYLLALGGGMTEPPATLALAAGLAIAVSPAVGRLRVAAVAGIILSAGCIVSLQAVPGAAAVAGLLVSRSHRPGLSARALVIGGALPIVLVVSWLVAAGAWPAAFDAMVTYNAAYQQTAVDAELLTRPVVAHTLLALTFVVLPAGMGLLSALRSPGLRQQVAVACLVWIGLSIVAFWVQGRFFAHYAIVLAVPAGVLVGLGVERLLPLVRPPGAGWRVAFALPLAVTVAISGWELVDGARLQLENTTEHGDRPQVVGAYVREHTQPGTSMLVWGNEPWLYTEADRLPALPYVYWFPLTTPGYTTPEMVRDVIERLRAHMPGIIVDAGSPEPGERGFLPLLIDRPGPRQVRNLDLLDPLRAFIDVHYDLLEVVDGWPVYRVKNVVDLLGAAE